jgi:hypothetical protein
MITQSKYEKIPFNYQWQCGGVLPLKSLRKRFMLDSKRKVVIDIFLNFLSHFEK